MSEQINMPVRRLKALNYDQEFNNHEGGQSSVKLFSSDEVMERMSLKKKSSNYGLGIDEDSEDEEDRRRREYHQQQLLMFRDGSSEEESDSQQNKEDMEKWLEGLHIKTQELMNKCKPRSVSMVATNHIATATVRLKGKKVKNSLVRDKVKSSGKGFTPGRTLEASLTESKNELEPEGPIVKEVDQKTTGIFSKSGEKRVHLKPTSGKQTSYQKGAEIKERGTLPLSKKTNHAPSVGEKLALITEP